MAKSIKLAPPTGGGSNEYLKIKEGEYRLRIVSPIISGYEAWNRGADSFKVHRAENPFTPTELQELGISATDKTKQFYAMVVWDYAQEKFLCWVVTQFAVKDAIYNCLNDEDWGDITGYDIVVNRTGTDMQSTKYSVMPKPHKKFLVSTADLTFNLENLYGGGDPFKS